MELIKF